MHLYAIYFISFDCSISFNCIYLNVYNFFRINISNYIIFYCWIFIYHHAIYYGNLRCNSSDIPYYIVLNFNFSFFEWLVNISNILKSNVYCFKKISNYYMSYYTLLNCYFNTGLLICHLDVNNSFRFLVRIFVAS